MVAADEVSKDKLRKYAKNLRKKIYQKESKEEIIHKKILNNYQINECRDILIYISMDFEVSTIKLIESLLKLNKNLYAPRLKNNNMEFYKFESIEELKMSKYNILEPISNIKYINNKNTVAIIPGLLFDKDNNRLGYGGGYYDRYLKNKKIYKIGICFSTFLVDKIIIDKYDIKMDEVITER